MSMVFLRTNDENIKSAEHLAPSSVLDKLSIPGFEGILAVDDEKRISVGLSICQMVGIDRFDIVWLFVHEDYRFKGVGDELIMASCDVAIDLGYKDIGFRVEARDLTESEVNDMDGFLHEHGFGSGFMIEGDIEANVDDAELNVDDINAPGVIVPLNEMDFEDVEKFVSEYSILFDENKISEDDYATEISFSYKNNGRFEGLLLGKAIGELVYIYLLEPSNNEDVAGLLLKALIDKMKGLGVKNFSILRTEKNDEILSKLFNTAYALPAHLWITNANMYDETPDENDTDIDPIYVPVPKKVRWLATELYGDVLY